MHLEEEDVDKKERKILFQTFLEDMNYFLVTFGKVQIVRHKASNVQVC